MSNKKAALITGGSRGIGAAIVQCFVAKGWDVVFTFVSDDAAAKQVAGATGARAIKSDVGREEDILSLFSQLDAEGIYIDALVNNAGITGPKRRLQETTWETLETVARVNFIGLVAMCREAANRMTVSNGGHGGAIVNISSTATKLGAPNQWADYAALKGAVDILTNGFAREVGEDGVRVNAVAPGYTMTDMARAGQISERFDQFRHEVPLGRIGNVEEIAAAVYWLCSDEASYVTGTTLPVSGGRC